MDGQVIAVVSADAAYSAEVNQALDGAGYQVVAIPPGPRDYRAICQAHPALILLALSARAPEFGWALYNWVRRGQDTRDTTVLKVQSLIGPAIPVPVEPWGRSWWG